MVASSELSRKVNKYFKFATKRENDKVRDQLEVTTEQATIFRMYYIEKKNADFIADTLNFSTAKVRKELETIRSMLDKII